MVSFFASRTFVVPFIYTVVIKIKVCLLRLYFCVPEPFMWLRHELCAISYVGVGGGEDTTNDGFRP